MYYLCIYCLYFKSQPNKQKCIFVWGVGTRCTSIGIRGDLLLIDLFPISMRSAPRIYCIRPSDSKFHFESQNVDQGAMHVGSSGNTKWFNANM